MEDGVVYVENQDMNNILNIYYNIYLMLNLQNVDLYG